MTNAHFNDYADSEFNNRMAFPCLRRRHPRPQLEGWATACGWWHTARAGWPLEPRPRGKRPQREPRPEPPWRKMIKCWERLIPYLIISSRWFNWDIFPVAVLKQTSHTLALPNAVQKKQVPGGECFLRDIPNLIYLYLFESSVNCWLPSIHWRRNAKSLASCIAPDSLKLAID